MARTKKSTPVEAPANAPAPIQVEMVPVVLITAGDNDRKTFDPAGLAELAQSIREKGLLQPITLRKLGPGAYQIVAGERRFRAMSGELAWSAVPALVRELTDEEAAALMLVENTSRTDLNPIEEADAYQVRIDKFQWTVQRVSEMAGVSVSRVQKRLALLALAPEVRTLVKHGHLPLGHAEILATLDHNRQIMAIHVYQASPGMSITRFREVTGELLREQDQEALFDLEQCLVVQVIEEAKNPLSGKRATTGAPMREDLPAIVLKQSDTAADVVERFIVELQAVGLAGEAATVGTLYERLVKGNFLNRSKGQIFLQAQETGA